MRDCPTDLPRRGLLRALVFAASAGLAAAAEPAMAQTKMSKQDAEYQDSPKDIRMCATCTLFEAPRSCKVVEGDISPNGWCKVFPLADSDVGAAPNSGIEAFAKAAASRAPPSRQRRTHLIDLAS